MSRERPGSVVAGIWSMTALIAVSGLSAVLTVVFKQRIIDSWSAGMPDTSSVQPPAFVPVALVMFIVIAMLAFVLVAFFRAGFGWARITLTVLVLLMAVVAIAILRAGPPLVFSTLAVLSLGLEVVVLVCLWHRDTGAYLAAEPSTSTSV